MKKKRRGKPRERHCQNWRGEQMCAKPFYRAIAGVDLCKRCFDLAIQIGCEAGVEPDPELLVEAAHNPRHNPAPDPAPSAVTRAATRTSKRQASRHNRERTATKAKPRVRARWCLHCLKWLPLRLTGRPGKFCDHNCRYRFQRDQAARKAAETTRPAA